MNIQEIKQFITDNKETDEVKQFLSEISSITPDKFKQLINTDPEIKKTHFSLMDGELTKRIDSWKTNNLQKLIDEGVSKKLPDETPQDKKLRILEERFAAIETEKTHEKYKNVALKHAAEKKLPINFIDRLVGKDEAETLANMEMFETDFNNAVKTEVELALKGKGRKINQNLNDSKKSTNITWEQVAEMDSKDLKKYDADIKILIENSEAE